jgi:hypothetical protein
MSEFTDSLSDSYDEAREVFGEELFTISGTSGVACDFSSLGYEQLLDFRGVTESFTATIEVPISNLATAPTHGSIVTRASDGKQFRIIGDVVTDILTHRLNLSTKAL